MKAFRIAINMAGAVSAGTYTAGVLDFLTEALDAWYKVKSSNESVPSHNVSIDVFSGASAGGMCAAISAILLQDEFDHISDLEAIPSSGVCDAKFHSSLGIAPVSQTRTLVHCPSRSWHAEAGAH